LIQNGKGKAEEEILREGAFQRVSDSFVSGSPFVIVAIRSSLHNTPERKAC
jgi:hypothetical protein